MAFKFIDEEVEFSLEIRGWQPPTNENRYEDWCKCDLRVKVGNYLDYSVLDDEFLEYTDIVRLERELVQLLNGDLHEELFECFVEPDLTFTLHPKIQEDTDICAEMCIALRKRDTNYTGVELTLYFDRGAICDLRVYLKEIING